MSCILSRTTSITLMSGYKMDSVIPFVRALALVQFIRIIVTSILWVIT